ncbi:MAG: hypothetical protein JWQ81_8420 [Amycolatopsis sp.]|jgi:hypothetical protein|uniref:hypothetical protein n=1 Tax=Amycolatopsis sp. TaxID=37632 RepID=UPI0026313BA5|nr:hypothetical protein [Amycolatopsis sp.]MCU1687681.1 hypothetical protein [Amycolatopsis sp.]
MRTMFDGVTASNLPADAQMVAGYLNGKYAWSAGDWARFPHAVKIGISVRSNLYVGQVLDVEDGDATATGAVDWVRHRRAAGADPTVYCNASTWPSVRSAFRNAGVAEPHYWIAKYDRNPALMSGAVAKQHTNTKGWDQSSVADYWPGVDGPTTTTTEEDEDMTTTAPAGTNEHVNLFVKGKSQLYLVTSYKDTLACHQIDFFKDTGSNPAGDGTGGGFMNVGIDPNRPGPLPIPAGAVMCTIRYTASHAWGIGVA